jgi:hypothetical protein
MILTDIERRRFVAWLEMTAETCGGIAIQMEKLPDPVSAQLVQMERAKAAACLFIANDLRNTETMVI